MLLYIAGIFHYEIIPPKEHNILPSSSGMFYGSAFIEVQMWPGKCSLRHDTVSSQTNSR